MRATAITLAAVLIGIGGCSLRPAIRWPERPTGEMRHVRSVVDSLLSLPELAATHVGLAVRSIDGGDWLLLHNPDKLFVPASNAKILVAAAALDVLGPGRTFPTRLLGQSEPTDSLLVGDLYLVAGGAPDLDREAFDELAGRLRARGIGRVRGNLVLDASRFDSAAFGPGWTWDEGPVSYNAPVNAFMFSRNTVRVTIRPGAAPGDTLIAEVIPPDCGVPLVVRAVTRRPREQAPRLTVARPGDTLIVAGSLPRGGGPVTRVRTVPNPIAYAGAQFVGALSRAGIDVEGDVAAGLAPDSGGVVLGWVRSAPVDILVRHFLKNTDNLYGEALVKQMGFISCGDGSWSAGLSAIRRSLVNIAGVDSASYRLADGSGLSRYSELSPRTLAAVIAGARARFTTGPEFESALAIGGVDGTLRRRLVDASVRSRVRAKTAR